MTPQLRRAGGGRGRVAALLLAAACTAMAGASLAEVARQGEPLAVLHPAGTRWLLAGLALASGASVLALLRAARAHGPRLPWRAALAVVLAAAVVYVAWLQPYRALMARATLGISAGLIALLMLSAKRLAAALPRRVLSATDLVVSMLCLALIGGELALAAWARTSSSPLFAREHESVAATIDRHRLRPETSTPDFPVNAGGHFDTEFHARGPDAPLAVCIGDSFSTSVVPHAFHFTTVAERELQRGAVHNMGFAGIGLAAYLHLAATEAVPLRPDVIVVNLFIGNDLAEGLAPGRDVGVLQRCLDARHVLLALVPGRLLRVAAAAPVDARPLDRADENDRDGDADLSRAAATPSSRAELEAMLPWLADPLLEVPGYALEAFAGLEQRRAFAVCSPDEPPAWARVQELLLQLRAACGDVPLRVMLIPDEFQVEDAVWELVLAAPGSERLDRDLPQRVLGAWLAEQGIPCLDLLPLLRAVPPLADGRRHLYHAQDTHFNARGNDVAGRALAEFLAPDWR